MGSSGGIPGGFGESLKKKARITSEGALGGLAGGTGAGVPGFIIGQKAGQKRIEKKQKEEQQLTQALTGEARAKEARAEAIKTAAEESVRSQQEKARKRTVFAGEGIRESLFRRVLSGGPSRRTLLGG
jgi:hypothetical protein